MEKNQDLNKELKEQINTTFADLFKEIGNNRQQLNNKVLNVQMGIIKELSKGKVDAKRQKEILHEVSATVKMAAQQLPHMKLNLPKPATPSAPSTTPTKKPTTPPAASPPPAKKKKTTKK